MTPFQSALDPAGRQAAHIATLWWGFFALLTAIFIIVLAAALWALTRRHRGIEQEPLERTHIPSASTEARLTRIVGSATIVTTVIIFALIVVSVSTGNAVVSISKTRRAMRHASNGRIRRERRKKLPRRRSCVVRCSRPGLKPTTGNYLLFLASFFCDGGFLGFRSFFLSSHRTSPPIQLVCSSWYAT